MSSPAVWIAIVDPIISANYLGASLRGSCIKTIAVLTGNHIARPEQFDEVLTMAATDEFGILEVAGKLRAKRVIRVIYGYEHSVRIADQLKFLLDPFFAKDFQTSDFRFDKFMMQEALRTRDIPAVRQIRVMNRLITAEQAIEVMGWERELVVKPLQGCGSAATRICANIVEATDFLAKDDSAYKDFVIQEKLEGIEYAVDTVTIGGRHRLASVQCYRKELVQGAPIHRHVRILHEGTPEYERCGVYVFDVLDAVVMEDGFAHTEFILTPHGPRLLEVNPRISGLAGFINRLARVTTGRDQPTVLESFYGASGTPVPLIPRHGFVMLLNNWKTRMIDSFHAEKIQSLPSYVDHMVLKSAGTFLAKPRSLVDCVGLVLIAHEREDQVLEDYQRIQSLEENNQLF